MNWVLYALTAGVAMITGFVVGYVLGKEDAEV